MNKYKPSISLFFDDRVEKKSGKFPIKLTVYCKPQKRRYKTNIDVSLDEWNKLNSDRLRDENLKEIKIKLNALTAKAQKIIESLLPFSFNQFEDAFFENSTNASLLGLKNLFERYSANMEKYGSISTAISYNTALNSLNQFKKHLSLFDITPRFLEDYERHMFKAGKSPSTVGIYLRQLRAVYNDAVARNLISKENYPFGKSKYIIPISKNVKKALSADELRMLLDYTPQNLDEQKALDFWVFSYLSNGMNFCDIARLKEDNISNEFISYIRTKTRNTKKGSQQQIRVPLHPKAKEILYKWRSNKAFSPYVFPILIEELNPLQIKYRVQDFIKKTNNHMDSIRKKLGITQKCNTYSCRHSFATVLKRKNVSTEFISESLGHASLLTTSSYLASFEDKTKIEYSNLLIDF